MMKNFHAKQSESENVQIEKFNLSVKTVTEIILTLIYLLCGVRSKSPRSDNKTCIASYHIDSIFQREAHSHFT